MRSGTLMLVTWTLLWGASAAAAQDRVDELPRAAHLLAARIDSLEAAALRFMYEWRLARRLTDRALGRAVHFPSGASGLPDRLQALGWTQATWWEMQSRGAHMMCDPATRGTPLMPLTHPRHVIFSQAAAFSACPSWQLHPQPVVERGEAVDDGLEERFVAPLRQRREALLAQFDSAAQAFPASDWIVGQHVRLLVEQGAFDRATAAVAACQPQRWWCTLLAGYVQASAGEVLGAERQLTAALAQMPLAERCRWTDAAVLLDSLGRAAYRRVPCAARDSVNAVLWWLADPLYSEPGNDRLVEHYRRAVDLALRAGLDRDGRYDWRPATGADARAEMLLRYGKPSLVVYSQGYNAALYLSYLLRSDGVRTSQSTFEYTPGRVHTVPQWQAVLDPARAPRTAWDLVDPGDQVHEVQPTTGARSLRPEAARARAQVSAWWPTEHYRHVPGLAPLPEGQVAFLRRQDSVMVATATPLEAASLGRTDGQAVAGTLLVTAGPGQQEVLVRATGRVGTPLVLVGTTLPRPAVAAIEFPGDRAAATPAGRTRFGIEPPPPLAVLAPGAVAISAPVLLHAPAAGEALPVATAAVLAHMAGTPVIRRGARLGVYWETYGIAPTDTVDLAVWIERYTEDGILRRLGVRLNVTTDRNTPVAVSWTETALGPNATVLDEPVPIVGRSLLLDTASLPPGDYWLDVVAGRAGQEPVRARRPLVVVAP
jgi:hypothetical protein